jgi:surface antigen
MFSLPRSVLLAVASLAAATEAATLATPAEGAFLKDPSSVTYTSTGARFSNTASIQLSAPNYSQVGWWYSYYGSRFVQRLNSPPPVNTWVTATFRDGPLISSRRYFTAFKWEVPSEIKSPAASTWYLGFPPGYCTNFASRAFHAGPGILASYVPWSGNAKDWIGNASAAGWQTSTSKTGAQIGAVVVWSGGSFGHVGVVVDMSRTSTPGEIEILVAEMNWGPVLDATNMITSNFGKVTTVKLKSSALDRSANYKFLGFVLPQRK